MTHLHPHYKALHKGIAKKKAASQKFRLHWELVVFVSLAVVFAVAGTIWNLTRAEHYFDIAEKSTLLVEIASFFLGGDA